MECYVTKGGGLGWGWCCIGKRVVESIEGIPGINLSAHCLYLLHSISLLLLSVGMDNMC